MMYRQGFSEFCFQLLTILLSVSNLPHQCHAQTHQHVLQLFEDKLGPKTYNTEVRPIRNQSRILDVNVTFQLVAIKAVDDVQQRFVCNGYLGMLWRDEIVAWNQSFYGEVSSIHPKAKDIWKPRLILANTLGDRDIFKDDHAPTAIYFNGFTTWFPGSLFSASCDLDLTKYPFDEQECAIRLMAMGWSSLEVNFHPLSDAVSLNYFSPHDEWELAGSRLITYPELGPNNEPGIAGITVTFHLKRRPNFLLLNVILPVVLLSLMNILVFLIPAESGEKVSYGITVLLALSVYLSFISGLLPRSSDNLPWVNIYIFILLIISVLTVVDSIIIVFLHHLEEKEARYLRTKENLKHAVKKLTNVRSAVQGMEVNGSGRKGFKMTAGTLPPTAAASLTADSPPGHDDSDLNGDEKPTINKYKMIGKHIDLVSLILFSVVWLGVTLGFMVFIST